MKVGEIWHLVTNPNNKIQIIEIDSGKKAMDDAKVSAILIMTRALAKENDSETKIAEAMMNIHDKYEKESKDNVIKYKILQCGTETSMPRLFFVKMFIKDRSA